jgi:hypothetical protein
VSESSARLDKARSLDHSEQIVTNHKSNHIYDTNDFSQWKSNVLLKNIRSVMRVNAARLSIVGGAF